MREVVVDASVAAKWVVEEDHSTLWSKALKGDLTATDAEERMAVLSRAPVIGTPVAGLMPRAFAISMAQAVTICDSLYVALAEKLAVPLVTADERLVRRLSSDTTVGKRMVWVGDLCAS